MKQVLGAVIALVGAVLIASQTFESTPLQPVFAAGVVCLLLGTGFVVEAREEAHS